MTVRSLSEPKLKRGFEELPLLRKVSEKAGIFFFFKSDCVYCERQAPLLAYLEELGFDILAISIDGGQLQSHQFKNTKVDAGQAQVLGVRATPAMFLMNEDGQFSALGQTVLSYADLRKRILLVAAREGSVRISVSGEVIPGAAQRGCPLYLRCSMPDLMR